MWRVLTSHQLGHTGEREHLCDHCGKTFTQLIHLRRHEKIQSGERPRQCDLEKVWSRGISWIVVCKLMSIRHEGKEGLFVTWDWFCFTQCFPKIGNWFDLLHVWLDSTIYGSTSLKELFHCKEILHDSCDCIILASKLHEKDVMLIQIYFS